MKAEVNLYTTKKGEINKFLNKFYNTEENINSLKWEKKFDNPVEIADIVGVFIDNKDQFQINMWISLDEGTFINITESNADSVIKYLFERFPY